VNVPFPAGRTDADLGAAFHDLFLPVAQAFRPDLVIVSAGFDAHEDDPLASLMLHEDDYEWVTAALAEVAKTHAKGRIVSALEGGYDLGALAASSAAHVRALMQAR
jgi:acetoin utilization deacetylase AcuC-like enzyme